MRRILTLFLFISYLCLSCSNNKGRSISPDKMALIVADLDLTDKMVRQYPLIQRDSVKEVLERNLLKIHNISEEELQSNLYLYQSDYKEYDKLLQRIGKNYKAKFE